MELGGSGPEPDALPAVGRAVREGLSVHLPKALAAAASPDRFEWHKPEPLATQDDANTAALHVATVAAAPNASDEVAFISGVDANGDAAATSFWTWNSGYPAQYLSASAAHKWGAPTADTSGGTVTYYFDVGSRWSTKEKDVFIAALKLWSDFANINFVATSNAKGADIDIVRGAQGSGAFDSYHATGGGKAGSATLAAMTSSMVSIDTSEIGFGPLNGSFSEFGGYAWMTVLHELGHAIGLGHAGPYNDTGALTFSADPAQFSAYDTRLWSIMSYIDPTDSSAPYYSQYTVKGVNWGSTTVNGDTFQNVPTTPMQLDILAAQALYGASTGTAFSGGQIFGFNCNITDATEQFYDFKINKHPVVTIWDTGTGNTLDLSGFKGVVETINLNPGTFSSVGGAADNLDIANGTRIDTVIGGTGADTITANADADHLTGGNGNDVFIVGASLTAASTIDGGAGSDTVELNGDYSATFNLSAVTNIERIALTAGHSYAFVSSDATFVKTTGVVDGSTLLSTDTLTFNGGAETESHLSLSGGAGNDALIGGAAADFLAANAGDDTLQGGAGNDEIGGGLGADRLTGGAGKDMFAYSSAAESTSTGYDTITDFDAKQDTLDIAFNHTTIHAVESPIVNGTLSTASFDSNLAAAMTSLAAYDAVLFTPNKGTLAGTTFLVVDMNGVAGYQTGQDLVIALTSPANMANFSTHNFVEK